MALFSKEKKFNSDHNVQWLYFQKKKKKKRNMISN